MKINEFSTDDRNEFKPSFDLVNDICVYMRNDPMFYRKNYFPMVDAMDECFKSNVKVNGKELILPVVNKAIRQYVEMYNLAKTQNEVFTKEDIKAIVNKVYSEEMGQIKKGTYGK
tara:strand:- start:166 stop:510 length:345 start_codon:yes stop_codon:yes gene_type:complete